MHSRTSVGGWLAVAGPAGAAIIGSIGARDAPEVYRRLPKPDWAPPPTAFGPVWTALYAAIALAGWRLQRRNAGPSVWMLHGAQLALNAAWPFSFFSVRDRRSALAVIALLDLAVAGEIARAVRTDRVAAGLLTPYLGWSLFATALTAAVGDPAEGS